MEHSEVKVEVKPTPSSTQVSPQDISITLRPGRPAIQDQHVFFFNLHSTGLRFYPRTLCFLEAEVKCSCHFDGMFVYVCLCVFSGSEASFTVAVTQLERYPVDLYYLVDVSASMQDNLNLVCVKTQLELNYSVVAFTQRPRY